MIPVNVVTGFLGSGKTTLLKEILENREFSDTAIIVNEFGEIGLDHILLEEVEEGVLLLESGCICCTIRSDLQETITSLHAKAAAGAIPSFSRLIIETTGLADPAPVVSTIAAEPVIRNHFQIGNIICTVDGIAGAHTIAHHEESKKQIAIADRILVTKADLADADEICRLEGQVRSLNPFAQLRRSTGCGFDASLLIAEELINPAKRPHEIARWFSCVQIDNQASAGHAHGKNRIESGYGLNSFVLEYREPIDWTAFGIWLTALLHAHGERILRVKGILNVKESETPVVLHGVQHVVHAPVHLQKWPTDDHSSRIIFITKGIAETAIKNALNVFLSMAETASEGGANRRLPN